MKTFSIVNPVKLEVAGSNILPSVADLRLEPDNNNEMEIKIVREGPAFNLTTPTFVTANRSGLTSGVHSTRESAGHGYSLGPASFSEPFRYSISRGEATEDGLYGLNSLGVREYKAIQYNGRHDTRIAERWTEYASDIYITYEAEVDMQFATARSVVVGRYDSEMAAFYDTFEIAPVDTAWSEVGDPTYGEAQLSPDLYEVDGELFVALASSRDVIIHKRLSDARWEEFSRFPLPEDMRGKGQSFRLRVAVAPDAIMIACYKIIVPEPNLVGYTHRLAAFVSLDGGMTFRGLTDGQQGVVAIAGRASIASGESEYLDQFFVPASEPVTNTQWFTNFNHKFALYYDNSMASFVILKSGDPFEDATDSGLQNSRRLMGIKTVEGSYLKWETCLDYTSVGSKYYRVDDLDVVARETDNVALLSLAPAEGDDGTVAVGREDALIQFAFVHHSQIGGLDTTWAPFVKETARLGDWYWVNSGIDHTYQGLSAYRRPVPPYASDAYWGGNEEFGDICLTRWRDQVAARDGKNDVLVTMGAWSNFRESTGYEVSHNSLTRSVADTLFTVATNAGTHDYSQPLGADVFVSPSGADAAHFVGSGRLQPLLKVSEYTPGFFKVKFECWANWLDGPGATDGHITLFSYSNHDLDEAIWADTVSITAQLMASTGKTRLHLVGHVPIGIFVDVERDRMFGVYLAKRLDAATGEIKLAWWLNEGGGWRRIYDGAAAPDFTIPFPVGSTWERSMSIGAMPPVIGSRGNAVSAVAVRSIAFSTFGVGTRPYMTDFGSHPRMAQESPATDMADTAGLLSSMDTSSPEAYTFSRLVNFADGSVLEFAPTRVSQSTATAWQWVDGAAGNELTNLVNGSTDIGHDFTGRVPLHEPAVFLVSNVGLAAIDTAVIFNVSGVHRVTIEAIGDPLAVYTMAVPKVKLDYGDIEGRSLIFSEGIAKGGSLVGRSVIVFDGTDLPVSHYMVVANSKRTITLDRNPTIGVGEAVFLMDSSLVANLPEWMASGVYPDWKVSLNIVPSPVLAKVGEIIMGRHVDMANFVTELSVVNRSRFSPVESDLGGSFSASVGDRNIVKTFSVDMSTLDERQFQRVSNLFVRLGEKERSVPILVTDSEGDVEPFCGLLTGEVARTRDGMTRNIAASFAIQGYRAEVPDAGAASSRMFMRVHRDRGNSAAGDTYNFKVVYSAQNLPCDIGWTIIGPDSYEVQMSGESVSFVLNNPGEYLVEVSLTDAAGNMISEKVSLLVSEG